ncbi:MAG TPA: hypothetical protein VGC58_02685 [Candidatus Paceibacterota bacterium]
MTFTKEQTREAYKNLSPEIQSFIMDNETTETVLSYFKECGLSDDQSNLADSEVLYSMYGLQTLQVSIENIAKLSGKKINDLSSLKTKLENNIFSKISSNKSLYVDWQIRVEEISKKYNLNDPQKNNLNSFCKEVFSDVSKKTDLLNTLDQKIGISKILSDQIAEDLEKRVFNYAVKGTAVKNVEEVVDIRKDTDIQIPKMEKMVYPKTTIPEIKPNNLPMVEKEEGLKIGVPKYTSSNGSPINTYKAVPPLTTPKTEGYRPSSQSLQNNPAKINEAATEGRVTYAPTKMGEPVQRPASVPRFNISEEKKEVPPETSPASNIVSDKLNSITSTITPEKKEPEKPTESPLVKNYTVDPYREPLE